MARLPVTILDPNSNPRQRQTSQTGTSSSQSQTRRISDPQSVNPPVEFMNFQDTINKFLADDSIEQSRKDAFLAAYNGLLAGLPENSGFDKLSQAIIGTSNYQKAINQASTSLGSLIAQYISTDYQEKYNSAASQAARLEQAGVNPDLQAVDAGTSADFDDQSTGLPSPASAATDGSSPMSIFTTLLQTVFSSISTIQGLMKQGIEIEGLQTSNFLSEQQFIEGLAHSSQLLPSEAISISPENQYPAPSFGGKLVSFGDGKGNFIPYYKLSAEQKDALSFLVSDNDLISSDAISSIIDFYNLPRQRSKRLKSRLGDYLKSERFRSNWYSDHAKLTSNRLQSLRDSESPLFSSFDNLLSGFQTALESSGYDASVAKNEYDKDYFDSLVRSGVNEAEALQRARSAKRDEADNKVFDEFRDSLLNVVKTGKNSDGSPADSWDLLTARLGLIVVSYLRSLIPSKK